MNVIGGVLYNTTTKRWHPIWFVRHQPSTMSFKYGEDSEDLKLVFCQSHSHHTEGFDTYDLAKDNIKVNCERSPDTCSDSGMRWTWNGSCIVEPILKYFPTTDTPEPIKTLITEHDDAFSHYTCLRTYPIPVEIVVDRLDLFDYDGIDDIVEALTEFRKKHEDKEIVSEIHRYDDSAVMEFVVCRNETAEEVENRLNGYLTRIAQERARLQSIYRFPD